MRVSARCSTRTSYARTAGRGGSLAGNPLRCKHDAESSNRLCRDGGRPLASAIAWKHAPDPTPPAARSPLGAALSPAHERFAGKRASGSRPRRVARRSRYRPGAAVACRSLRAVGIAWLGRCCSTATRSSRRTRASSPGRLTHAERLPTHGEHLQRRRRREPALALAHRHAPASPRLTARIASATTKTETSDRLGPCRPGLLLWVGEPPERQSAAGFSAGDKGEVSSEAPSALASARVEGHRFSCARWRLGKGAGTPSARKHVQRISPSVRSGILSEHDSGRGAGCVRLARVCGSVHQAAFGGVFR